MERKVVKKIILDYKHKKNQFMGFKNYPIFL